MGILNGGRDYTQSLKNTPPYRFFEILNKYPDVVVEFSHPDKLLSKVYVENGRVVYVQSDYSPEHTKIGYVLKTLGIITDKELEKVLEIQKSTGKKTGEIVIQMKKMDFQMLDRVLNYQQELKLIFILSSRISGMKVVSLKESVEIPRYSINSTRALFTSFKNILKGCDVSDFGEKFKFHYIVWRGKKENQIVSSNRSEQQIVNFIISNSGTKTIQDIFTISRLTREKTLLLLFTLHQLFLIEFSEVQVRRVEDVEKELMGELEELKSRNYFDRLNAHWSCVPHEIERWYKTTLSKYEIRTDDSERVKALKKEIKEILKEAYEKLMDDEFRKKYRNQIVGEYRIKLGTDLLYEKAETEIFLREDPNSAMELFSTLVEVGDRRPKVIAGLGCCLVQKYINLDKGKMREGEELIERAIKEAPSDEHVYLYSARRYAIKGSINSAIQELQKVLQLKPGHPEALRQLKKLTGKE